MTDLTPDIRAWFGLLALAVTCAVAPPAAADDPCVRPICRAGYHYDGERCESEPDPITRARSHYYPDSPLCPGGWRVSGPNCVKVVCCDRPACDDDERYREGYCHSGPTFFGWRSHHRATCDEGWNLNERPDSATSSTAREGSRRRQPSRQGPKMGLLPRVAAAGISRRRQPSQQDRVIRRPSRVRPGRRRRPRW